MHWEPSADEITRILGDQNPWHATGAVPQALAATLGLQPGATLSVRTANGTVQAWRTQIDRLQLGAIELRDVAALITPAMEGDQVLLGMSALKRLEFTQRDGQLLLRQTTLP